MAGRCAIGLDAGGTKLLCGVVDEDLEVRHRSRRLIGGLDRERLRRCDGPGCVLFFVATNPRRRWCSPAICGNRVRVARHYDRHQRGRGAA
jgi:predicted RNA-binding Zn ribbon-like protein